MSIAFPTLQTIMHALRTYPAFQSCAVYSVREYQVLTYDRIQRPALAVSVETVEEAPFELGSRTWYVFVQCYGFAINALQAEYLRDQLITFFDTLNQQVYPLTTGAVVDLTQPPIGRLTFDELINAIILPLRSTSDASSLEKHVISVYVRLLFTY